jgi:hypothetical protein
LENRVDTEDRLSFTLPHDLDQRLRWFAANTERSLAAVVRLALRQLLVAEGDGLSQESEQGNVSTPMAAQKALTADAKGPEVV